MADYSSILRRKEPAVSSNSNTDVELLVFGYSCKLFRDDEKALFIDQGKHLIPWMGDEALKIDRYDGRGTLSDLKAHEAQPGMSADECLTEAERKVEQLCNEERYRALHCNEDEEALYQEEELKRLHRALESKAYGQVAFNYDANSTTTTSKEAAGDGNDTTSTTNPGSIEEASGDEPFVPPPDLQLPENMVVPDTNKLNAIIVKTALFIAEQGAQMEIILKTKQSSNPQFAFLSYGTSLHTYYKFLVKKIKQGEWQPQQTDNNSNSNSENSKNIDDDVNDEDDDDDSSYLHPSLDPNNKNPETAPMPWQPPLSSLPLGLYKPSANCSYSMLVNKIKDKQQQQQPATTVSTEMSSIGETQTYVYETQPKEPVIITSGPILYSRHYEDLAARAHHFPPRPPTNDEYTILDKMASYVAKNGRDFENVVRSKGDPRFSFLDYRHPHHVYYQQRLVQYELREAQAQFNAEADRVAPNGVMKTPPITTCTAPTLTTPVTTLTIATVPTSAISNSSIKKKIKPAPVSFSIKKPKEGESVLEKSSALPNEESSEEEEISNINTTSITIPPPIVLTTLPIIVTPTLTTISASSNLNNKAINIDNNLQTNTTALPTIQISCEKEKVKPSSPKVEKEKPSTEVIDLTEDSIDERQKIDEDPNSMTLTSSTTNRQIQLERKRRATAFLNKIHKEKGLSKNHQTHVDNTNSTTKDEEIVPWPSAGSSGNNSPNGSDLAERLGLKNGSSISQPKSSISKNSHHSSRRHNSSEEDSDDPRRKHSKRSRNDDHYHSSRKKKKSSESRGFGQDYAFSNFSSFASGSSSGSSSSRFYKHSKKNRDRESSRHHESSHSSHSRRRHSSSRRKHCLSSSESS